MDGKVILGIDPGTNRTGYGIVRSEGNALHLVVLGDIDLHRIGDPYRKLQHIFERVCQLIDTYRPDEAALESPFFGANVQSMLKLGRAQGVAMAAALSRGLPVSEYAPRRVKQAITGRGSASKEQVASLLKSMLHMTELPSHLDATDGLAVAVCHHFQCSVIGRIDPSPRKKALGGGRTGSKSWAEFISSHPDRIKGKEETRLSDRIVKETSLADRTPILRKTAGRRIAVVTAASAVPPQQSPQAPYKRPGATIASFPQVGE